MSKHTKFRKKPVVVGAVQFSGTNHAEVFAFCPIARNDADDPESVSNRLWIPTLEGGHVASPGDWIIKGVKGEFYPCKPDIFDATYEPATSSRASCEILRGESWCGAHSARAQYCEQSVKALVGYAKEAKAPYAHNRTPIGCAMTCKACAWYASRNAALLPFKDIA